MVLKQGDPGTITANGYTIGDGNEFGRGNNPTPDTPEVRGSAFDVARNATQSNVVGGSTGGSVGGSSGGSSSKGEDNSGLYKQINELQSKISQLNSTIAEKDKTINEQKNTIAQLEQENAQLEQDNSRLQSKVSSLQNDLNELANEDTSKGASFQEGLEAAANKVNKGEEGVTTEAVVNNSTIDSSDFQTNIGNSLSRLGFNFGGIKQNSQTPYEPTNLEQQAATESEAAAPQDIVSNINVDLDAIMQKGGDIQHMVIDTANKYKEVQKQIADYVQANGLDEAQAQQLMSEVKKHPIWKTLYSNRK